MKRRNKHIILLGSARSGTSWLCENLSRQPRYRLLFEPEHPNHVREGKFIADHSMSNLETKVVLRFFEKLFANKIDNDWIAQHSYRKYKRHLWPFIPKFFVIKMIRVNLLVSFFLEHFNYPTIVLIRNPYSVIHSQNRVKFPWLYDLSAFAENDILYQYLLKSTSIDLRNDEFEDFEKLVIRWGIENALYPIHDHPNLSIYKYEDLRNDYALIENLMLKANMNIPNNLRTFLREPSSKTHKNSDIFLGDTASGLDANEQTRIKEILSKFPVQHYSL